jgi:hypothetical protein
MGPADGSHRTRRGRGRSPAGSPYPHVAADVAPATCGYGTPVPWPAAHPATRGRPARRTRTDEGRDPMEASLRTRKGRVVKTTVGRGGGYR